MTLLSDGVRDRGKKVTRARAKLGDRKCFVLCAINLNRLYKLFIQDFEFRRLNCNSNVYGRPRATKDECESVKFVTKVNDILDAL